MRKLTVGMLCVLAAYLSGCGTTTEGPHTVFTTTGPTTQNPQDGPAKVFKDAESYARPQQGADPESMDSQMLAKQMFLQGSALIYANCNAYFDSAGQTQKWLIVSRDTVGAVGAVATSIMVLARADKQTLAALGIGTGAAYASIDLYTKDFLFSADNIDAVRTLVNNALAAHAQKVLASTTDSTAIPPTKFTYDFAAGQLIDEQTICTDRRIAALAVQAIAKGHLDVSSSLDDDLAKVANMRDQFVLQGLGTLLGTPGPLQPDEAGLLWWIFQDGARDLDLDAAYGQLSELKGDANPLDDADGHAVKSQWRYAAAVNRALDGFSDATKAAFETKVTAAVAAAEAKKKVISQVTSDTSGQAIVPELAKRQAAAAPVRFQLGPTSAAGSNVHFTVNVR